MDLIAFVDVSEYGCTNEGPLYDLGSKAGLDSRHCTSIYCIHMFVFLFF